jgi:hypothetical protein
MPEFHGNETPAEVMRAALDDFLFKSDSGITAEIKYKGKVPYRHFFFPGEFASTSRHRLDNLLMAAFTVCETVVGYIRHGLLEKDSRDWLVRMTSYVTMSAMLQVLMGLHTKVWADSIEDIRFLTPAILLNSIADTRPLKDPNAVKKGVRRTVKSNLKKRLDIAREQ